MGKLAWMGRCALAAAALAAGAAEVDGVSGVDVDPGGVTDRDRIYETLRQADDEAARGLLQRHLQRAPDDAVMLYNAACIECRLGATQPAARYLLEAIKAGFADFSHLRRDPDLRPLRAHPVYRAIVAASRAADETLTRRRLEEWRQRLRHGSYRYEIDEAQRLAFVTALDDDAHAAAARMLTAQAAHLQRTLLRPRPGEGRGWVLVVVPSELDARALLTRPGVAGVYNHRRRELVSADAGRGLRHELVHALHHDHMDALGQDHALWIQEGLALLYERYRLGPDGVGFPPNDRHDATVSLAAGGRLMSWSELVAITPDHLAPDAFRVYPQLRSIFRFIAEHGKLSPWYDAYVAGFDDDPTGIAALEGVFDRPLAEIESAWRRWLDEQGEG